MAESKTMLNKAPLHIQSTQEALSLLRNLRENRKKQSPSSTYELVKHIYSHLKGINSKKGSGAQTISADDYLGNNKESIESMLFFIKEKIIEGEAVHTQNSITHESNPQIGENGIRNSEKIRKGQQNQTTEKLTDSQHRQSIQKLQRVIKQKQTQIIKLNQTIKNIESNGKSIQIKLLNNMKKLTVQLQQKQKQIRINKQAIKQKNMQLQQLILLNDKKQKKIRKLEEDIYDLQIQLQTKNQELQAERDCADFLQKKIDKLMDHEASIIHQKQQEHYHQSEHSIKNLQIRFEKLETGIQTQEIASTQAWPANSQQKNKTTQLDNDDKQSQCSSILTESKQSKYIESIERLTLQLGQAYQRINDLIKNDQHQNVVHTQQNMRLQQYENKGTKSKTKSGHYSNFWK